jgi:hypothetical protein
MRYTIIHINHDPTTGQQELLTPAFVVESDADIETVLWAENGWLDGIDGHPVGRIERHPEGFWAFPGEPQFRMYVQVG